MTDDLLRAIAERYGTPTYVYDLNAVSARVEALRRAVPVAALRFALKANSNGAVLRHLAGLGVGAEVITEGELARALRAGIASADIVLGGPAQGAGLIAQAAQARVGLVSLDSGGQWAAWAPQLEPEPNVRRFLVRINPALDPHTHEHLATGMAGSKFGLPVLEAVELAGERQLGSGHLVLDGTGVFLGDLSLQQVANDVLDGVLALEGVGNDLIIGVTHAGELQLGHQVDDLMALHHHAALRTGSSRS